MATAKLPLAEGLCIGSLENGLKYYVWTHPEPKGYCELRLFVAVGSWCENDSESGLAHFVEHMAFKTTARFSSQGSVIRFLETKGAQYGHDLNASTGLFDTVYKFQIPIREGLDSIADGLSVLAEWASGIQATTVDVETEKPVIREEWRTKRGARERLKAKYWHDAVDPRVAARFPIGSLDVIANTTAEQVQCFYHKWYRPDLMGVAVVGDMQKSQLAEVVDQIRKYFGGIQSHGSQHNMLAPPTPQAGVMTCFLQDAEVTSCSVSLELLHQVQMSPDISHLQHEVARRLFLTILERRFSVLLRGGGSGPPCPPVVVDLSVASRPLLPILLCTSVSATVAADSDTRDTAVADALTVLARELVRLSRHGVHMAEITRAVASWLPIYSADRTVTAAELVGDCLQHFRFKGCAPLAGPKLESAACREFLDRPHDVAAAVGYLAAQFCPNGSSDAWRVCIQCGPGSEIDVGKLWAGALSTVAADPAPPWTSMDGSAQDILELRQATLERLVPFSCDKVSFSSKAMPSVEAIEFTFPNGVVACCLRRATPGKIALQGFALGGSTELDELDECAMGILDDIAAAAGVHNELDATAMADLQSATQTRVHTQRHLYHRGIGGSTSTGKLELLLRMLVSRLKVPDSRFHSAGSLNALARSRARLADDIKQREQGPHYKLGQRARILSCGGIDIPVLRPVENEAVASLTAERCSSLHIRGFAHAPALFTFVLVGDLPEDDNLGRILASSLGSLEGSSDSWLPKHQKLPTALPSGFAKGVVKEIIVSNSAEKATVLLIFHTPVPQEDIGRHHLEAIIRVQAACKCAQDRLLECLRREAGGVYSVSVTFGRTSLSPHGHITISFDCDPVSHIDLVHRTLNELRKLQEMGPSPEEAGNVRSALSDVHARNLAGTSANSYWLFYMLDAYKGERLRQARAAHTSFSSDTQRVEDDAYAASSGRAGLIGVATMADQLKAALNEYLNLDNYVHLVLGPEATNTENETALNVSGSQTFKDNLEMPPKKVKV